MKAGDLIFSRFHFFRRFLELSPIGFQVSVLCASHPTYHRSGYFMKQTGKMGRFSAKFQSNTYTLT